MISSFHRSRAGMSLVEVMVSTGILLIAVIGILFTYVKSIELNTIGKGAAIATAAVYSRLEQIKRVPFDNIRTQFNNIPFTVSIPGTAPAILMNGVGVTYVDDTDPSMLIIKIEYSWRLVGGRVIGGDKNVNGVPDAGDTLDARGWIDSYVQITTQIYKQPLNG